ncbi:kinase binding protein CGI-121-domain-containing protein, partial [Entophlyctis helioformis]
MAVLAVPALLDLPQPPATTATATTTTTTAAAAAATSDILGCPHVHLFTGVANTAALLPLLRAPPSPLGPPSATYLDAARLLSPFQLAVAVAKARLNVLAGRMRTRSLQAEILLALSPDTSIADAFARFGLSSATSAILVVSLDPNDDVRLSGCCEVLARLKHHIQGTHVADSLDLAALRDMDAISKV